MQPGALSQQSWPHQNPLARTCLCQDISSKDQEFSHKKPRRSTREQNRTPRAQGLSTSRVLVLSIFLPPRNPFALTFSGILRARFPGVTAPPPRKPRQVPRKSRPPAPPPRAHPQPCCGPKTSWIALLCPLNMGLKSGANDCGQPRSQYVYMFGRKLTLLTPRDSC